MGLPEPHLCPPAGDRRLACRGAARPRALLPHICLKSCATLVFTLAAHELLPAANSHTFVSRPSLWWLTEILTRMTVCMINMVMRWNMFREWCSGCRSMQEC